MYGMPWVILGLGRGLGGNSKVINNPEQDEQTHHHIITHLELKWYDTGKDDAWTSSYWQSECQLKNVGQAFHCPRSRSHLPIDRVVSLTL